MPDPQAALALAADCGFSPAGELDCRSLAFLPEVRALCAADRCRCYGRNWSCPPACGTLAETAARAAGFRRGILVQTVDRFARADDHAAMLAAGAAHRARLGRLLLRLRMDWPGLLAMGAGACSLCETCTCPDAPCRFPDQAIPSMEACGLRVDQVCRDNGLDWDHGPLSVTYTSCVLLD